MSTVTIRPFNPQRIPAPPLAQAGWPALTDCHEVDLEIGAGAGLHAIHYAKANPNRLLIAIERTSKAERLQRRAKNHPKLSNLLAYRSDAIHWVTHFVPELSLSRIFLLYPNPYPKARQQNLRWHAMPFMGFLLSRLKAQGELILATNEAFYAQEAKNTFCGHWGLQLKSEEILSADSIPRTHFEKKYLARGELCRNLIFLKSGVSI
ncbi:MAG: tRNA (guanosine(46)-N(7))-methyltransferase TrmB [Bdellovibrionales bacterium]